MKRILIAFMLSLPLMAASQNTWEIAETADVTKTNPDQKYLAGAVPEVNGRVVFHTVVDAPGKSAAQVYAIVKQYMEKMIKEPNQFEQSRIVIDEPDSCRIIGSYQEWLVFKSTALSLDRTRLFYTLMAECHDGKADITLMRIHYLYEEERNPQAMTAEEWITDKHGLNRKQTKLARISGKFRRKTIDRKDYLFNKIQSLLK